MITITLSKVYPYKPPSYPLTRGNTSIKELIIFTYMTALFTLMLLTKKKFINIRTIKLLSRKGKESNPYSVGYSVNNNE
jgi:hypothetical protein